MVDFSIASSKSLKPPSIREAAHLLGWRVWSTWNSKHSPPGEPDLRMIRPPPRVIFAEIKVGKDKLRRDQQDSIADLMMCPGVEVYVWRETDNFDAIVEVLR